MSDELLAIVERIREVGGKCDRVCIPPENVEATINAGLEVEIYIVDPAPPRADQ